MPQGRWATMQDVADLAKVGKITVSRVVRTPDKVAEATRMKVLAAIQELGYVPDETAGALASNRSKIIGAIVSTLGDSVFASTIEGLSRVLRQSGYELILSSTDNAPEYEAAAIRALLGRRPAGLVLTSTTHSDEATKLLHSSGLPVVELWDLPDTPIDSVVGFSNKEAAAAIVEYLVESGRRNIAFIGGDQPYDHRGKRRVEGYCNVLLKHGLGEPKLVRLDDPDLPAPDRGAQGLTMALSTWPDIDAVVCVSDPVALGALSEAQRRGVDVPGALAVVGFGGFQMARESALNLTTVKIPGAKIGEMAARLMLQEHSEQEPKVHDVGFELAIRGTS